MAGEALLKKPIPTKLFKTKKKAKIPFNVSILSEDVQFLADTTGKPTH
jgi:hypothetical protein